MQNSPSNDEKHLYFYEIGTFEFINIKQGLTQNFLSGGPQDHQLRESGGPTILNTHDIIRLFLNYVMGKAVRIGIVRNFPGMAVSPVVIQRLEHAADCRTLLGLPS